MQEILKIAMIAAEEAGDEIMDVYDSNETINYQEKSDQSPLTIADKKSNDIIIHHLSKTGLNIRRTRVEKIIDVILISRTRFLTLVEFPLLFLMFYLCQVILFP